MSDDLMLPQVPAAKSEDSEDVSWALSTAEAMWARGEHSEGIKWVRRAAEAASEAEHDSRALELAKAAADLAGMIARQTNRSVVEIDELADVPTPPPVPPPRTIPPAKPSKPAGSVAPKPSPSSATRQFSTPSRPPSPLSRPSSPPAPKPKTETSAPPSAPATSRPASMRPAPQGAQGKKAARKSRENLDAEARGASQFPPAPKTAPLPTTDTGETLAVQVPHRKRSVAPESSRSAQGDHTKHGKTDEWSAASADDGDRMTVVGAPPGLKATAPPRGASILPNKGNSNPPPSTVTGEKLKAGVDASRAKDNGSAILTTQAVRVVVWRDANGVHVAPAGTVVSAITVDAMLVGLEPSADLTAWLAGARAGQRRG